MEMAVRALNALIPVFDFVGIVAFALSGVFEGIKRRIDPVGVFIVAFSTAFIWWTMECGWVKSPDLSSVCTTRRMRRQEFLEFSAETR